MTDHLLSLSIILALVFVLYIVFIAPRRELWRGVPLALGSSKTLIGAKYAFIWKAQGIIANGLTKVRVIIKALGDHGC